MRTILWSVASWICRGGACGIELELAIGCFFSLFFCSFLFVLVGRIDLDLCVLITCRCHSIVGGLDSFKVEAERFDFKKKKKMRMAGNLVDRITRKIASSRISK